MVGSVWPKKNGCIRSFQTFFLYSRNRRVKLASELKEPIKPPVKENWSPCGLCIREAAVLALIRDLIYLECLLELHSSARTSVSLKVFQPKAGWTCAVVVSSLEILFILSAFLSIHSAWINITSTSLILSLSIYLPWKNLGRTTKIKSYQQLPQSLESTPTK